MGLLTAASQALCLLSLAASVVDAQVAGAAAYTDPVTQISFWNTKITTRNGPFEFGIALPPEGSGRNDEYIGRLVGAIGARGGWSGLSHKGPMTNSLLLLAWADGDQVRTSFRWARDYSLPDPYKGNANLTTLTTKIEKDRFEIIYKCDGCWIWEQDAGNPVSQDLTAVNTIPLGYAEGRQSPAPRSDMNGRVAFHDGGFGIFTIDLIDARQAGYDGFLDGGSTSSNGTSSSSGPGGLYIVNGTESTGSANSTERPHACRRQSLRKGH